MLPGPDPQKKPQMSGPRRPPQPPQRRPPLPRPPPRPRRHHHGKAGRARLGLVVIFLLLRLIDGLFFLALPTGPHGPALAAIIGASLWTTALLVAIWRRQEWARIILLALFGISGVTASIVAPSVWDNDPLITAFITGGVIVVACGIWLGYSRDVHRLISRARE